MENTIQRQDLTRLKIKIKSLAAESTIIRRAEQRYKTLYVRIDPERMELARRTHKAPIRAIARFYKKVRQVDEQSLQSLRFHRKHCVGHESRLSSIAYGYLREAKYENIEQPLYSPITEDNAIEIYKMIKRFEPHGSNSSPERFISWLPETDFLKHESLLKKIAR